MATRDTTTTSAGTPQVIPVRLPPTAKGKAAFGRDELAELTDHLGLPINKVVQMALRCLHKQEFPSRYETDRT